MKKSELRQIIKEVLLKEGDIRVGNYLSLEKDESNYEIIFKFWSGPDNTGHCTRHEVNFETAKNLINILKKLV